MSLSAGAEVDEACSSKARSGRLYYGWVMLPVATAGLIATSPGQTYGVSVFNEPLREALGLSHSQLAAAYMFGTMLAAVPITYFGNLTDRFGLRRMMLIAVLLFGSACLLASCAVNWFTLFLAFCALRMFGPGALAFLSSNVMSYWFHEKLGTVEGIRNLGMAVAMAIVPAVNLYLVNSLGWRGAYAALGLAVWVIMLPMIFLLFRNRPEDVGQHLDGLPGDVPEATEQSSETKPIPALKSDFSLSEALRTRAFWIAMSGTGMFSLIQTAIFFGLVPIFLDRGLTEGDAVAMLSTFAVTLAGVHIVAGRMADKYPARIMLSIGLALLSLGIFLLWGMTSAWMGHLSGVVLGFGQGIYYGAINPLWARYYGRLHLGKIRGSLMTANVAASSMGPMLAGLARDWTGNDNLILMFYAIIPLPIAILALWATPPIKAIENAD